MGSLAFRRLLGALSYWFDQQSHIEGCEFGQVVQSGPSEGNKCHCTCGLLDLQKAIIKVKEES